MHPWITKNLIYYPIQAYRGERVKKSIAEIRTFHRLPREEMTRIQLGKLRSLMQFLYAKNPYYREIFDESGFDVRHIESSRDLERLPFLTKADLNARSSEMLSQYSGRTSKRKTSGSTGIPLVFEKDRDATAYMDALMYEVYSWHGIDIGDRQSRVWGVPLDTTGKMTTRIKDILLNRRRLSSFKISDDDCTKYFKSMKSFKPAFMYGLPNTIASFASTLQSAGYDPSELKIGVVITTGEILTPVLRDSIANAFNCRVVNEYGSTECGIIAFECSKGKLHLMNHNMIVEFVDPDTGEPVDEGQLGEVVLTELHSYAMPFVRYRVGDMARPIGGKCECGLESPLVEEVVGRVSDLIHTPEGKRVNSALLSYSMPPQVLQFRSIQKNAGKLEVFLKVRGEFDNSHIAGIERRLRKQLGDAIRIEIMTVDEIPPEKSGKFRHFVSEMEVQTNRS